MFSLSSSSPLCPTCLLVTRPSHFHLRKATFPSLPFSYTCQFLRPPFQFPQSVPYYMTLILFSTLTCNVTVETQLCPCPPFSAKTLITSGFSMRPSFNCHHLPLPAFCVCMLSFTNCTKSLSPSTQEPFPEKSLGFPDVTFLLLCSPAQSTVSLSAHSLPLTRVSTV